MSQLYEQYLAGVKEQPLSEAGLRDLFGKGVPKDVQKDIERIKIGLGSNVVRNITYDKDKHALIITYFVSQLNKLKKLFSTLEADWNKGPRGDQVTLYYAKGA